jgi:hypothetical protein
MNASVKPAKLGFNHAYNYLQTVVLDCIDDYAKSHPSIDAWDFACHVEKAEKAKFVEYVKARTDWPSIATDDALVSAKDAMECYTNPERFRELVDDALFRHFQNTVEWADDIHAILARSGYLHNRTAYQYPRLVGGAK